MVAFYTIANDDFCPFLYQGQYYDKEIQLAYNRFRYYDPEDGVYISVDPIGLMGGMAFYGYVEDTNGWLDLFGFNGIPTLPTSVVVNEGGVTIEHYYPNDHLEPHLHVYEHGKKGRATKIGENGKPLDRQRQLTAKEAKVVNNHKKKISKVVKKIRKWFGFKLFGKEYFKRKENERKKRKSCGK